MAYHEFAVDNEKFIIERCTPKWQPAFIAGYTGQHYKNPYRRRIKRTQEHNPFTGILEEIVQHTENYLWYEHFYLKGQKYKELRHS